MRIYTSDKHVDERPNEFGVVLHITGDALLGLLCSFLSRTGGHLEAITVDGRECRLEKVVITCEEGSKPKAAIEVDRADYLGLSKAQPSASAAD